MTNAIDTGYFKITYLDSLAGKMKGTFRFKARDPITDKTIDITNGYFSKVP